MRRVAVHLNVEMLWCLKEFDSKCFYLSQPVISGFSAAVCTRGYGARHSHLSSEESLETNMLLEKGPGEPKTRGNAGTVSCLESDMLI